MAKIIEAKAIISAEDRTGAVFDNIAKKINGIAKTAKTAKAVDEVSKAVERAQKTMTAIDKFDMSRGGLASARQRFNETKAAVESMSRAIASTTAPTREMEANFRRAQRAVSSASQAYDAQKSTVIAHKRELEGMGINVSRAAQHQTRLREAMVATSAAIDKQAARQEKHQVVAERWQKGVAIGAATLAAGAKVKNMGKSAIVSAAEFDIGTRKQREFNDIGAADQAAILTPQAKKIGQDTQFSNLDVVKAQTATMQGLPSSITGKVKAEIGAGIMENVKNYALVMEADLKTSAEAVRSYLQTTGKDISTKEKALAESQKAVNQIVKMAKLGGMNDDDVQSYLRYGAASGTAAGIDPETMMSLGALARRGGLRGDTAGTFMRSAASKLVAPTKQGLTALNSAGINYRDYVKMPNSLDPDRLEGQFKNDLGKSFTPAVRANLSKIMSDPKIIGDRGSFTEAVTGAVSPLFGTKKDGTMSAANRAQIAKTAGAFHKTSAESVDSQGLLDKIMGSDMTLAQLNAFFTDKHGGKAAITQRQREEYVAGREQLRATGDDPDFAKKKADEIMGGLGGSFERLKGSVENLTLSIGNAMEPIAKPGFEKLGNAMDFVSNLPPWMVGAGASIGAYGSVVGTGALMAKLTSGFGLGASAIALDGAAAALTAAAGTIAGGKVAGVAAGAAGSAAAGAGATAAAGSSLWAAGAAALPWLAAAGGVGASLGAIRLATSDAGYDGMTSGERMRKQRGGSMRDTYRRAWGYDGVSGPEVSQTMTYGTGATGGGPLTATLTGSGEMTGETTVKVEVQVSPTSEMLSAVATAKSTVAQMKGQFNAGNGPGSLGKSSPDAAAPNVGKGASGSW